MAQEPTQEKTEVGEGINNVIESELNHEFKDVKTQIHVFDPDAPPELKAKQAVGSSNAGLTAMPAVKGVVSDATLDQVSDKKDKKEEEESVLPCDFPQAPKPTSEAPKWARIGWKNVAEFGPTDIDHDIFGEYLSELYYGNLWLNASVIFISVFATWIITSLGGGLATYYANSMKRFYRNARSDISRELAREKLETMTGESVGWMNEFLRRFWLIYEPVLSSTIVGIADGILASATPTFVDSVRLKTFTLGTKPATIEYIRSYPKTEDDIVVMDWKLSFDPNDLANMTKAQLKNKVNPKIVLSVRLGRGVVGAESALGVLKLKVMCAKGLKNAETFGTSDPYAKVTLHGNKVLAKTKTIDDSLNPVWDETYYLILTSLNEGLHFEIFDYNEMSRDKPLGKAEFMLSSLLDNPKQEDVTLPVLVEGKPHGEIKIGAIWYPVVEATEADPAPESNLDPRHSLVGQYNPYAELVLNGKIVHTTRTIKRNNNPVWEEPFEMFITNKAAAELSVKVRDARDLASDPVVGSWSSKLQDFIDILALKNDWFNVTDASAGKLRLSCTWKPVLFDHELEHGGYGKSDPYVIIRLSSTYRGRTEVVLDTQNPEWKHELHYIPVHSLKESVALQVLSHESRDFGSVDFYVDKLAQLNEEGSYQATEPFDAFHPTLQTKKVKTPEKDSEKDTVKDSEKDSENLLKKDEKKGETDIVNGVENINVLDYESGILVVHIKNANLDKKDTSVELYVDNGLFPVFMTRRCKTANPDWNQGRTPIGICTRDVRPLLEQSDPENISLAIEGLTNKQLNIGVRYLPMNYKIDPSESINNMGTLRVTVKSAENLPAADRSGTSDPFAYIYLNEEKIYKTKHVKKTLNPVFENEDFTVNVLSRTSDKFHIEIWDWNKIEISTKLGTGTLDLSDLPTFEKVDRRVQLYDPKTSEPAGFMNLSVLFNPQLITKKKLTTGSLAGATRTLTNIGTGIGGTVVSGGDTFIRTGAGFVSTGANSVAGAVGSGFGLLKKKDKDDKLKNGDSLTRSIDTGLVVEDEQVYIPNLTSSPPPILLQVRDYNTIGKDVTIGEYYLKLWEHIEPGNYTKDCWVDLLNGGNGKLHLKIEFEQQ
ncbi:2591_t:CDS:10 [Racocetra fulgida]|uniref:2591_t:CDS:1 n=1 Tax=Racocetra fulgida TaxID=60492 RepID=A0A9N8WN80_9GLOM|nr:2591_t:CDS:10 [Racocetra fulgida]